MAHTIQIPVLDDHSGQTIQIAVLVDNSSIGRQLIELSHNQTNGQFVTGKRKNELTNQLKYINKKGAIVSFFPLLGIKPNSKRRNNKHVYDYTTAGFSESVKKVPIMSAKQFNELLSNNPTVAHDNQNVKLKKLAEPTTVELLMQDGFTRQEALEQIAKRRLDL